MSFEQLMGAVQRLTGATDALAAIGAELALKVSGDAGDPEIAAKLSAVAAAAGISDLETLPPPQLAMALAIIRMNIAEANDLLNNPARPPGWTATDPLILDGYGRGSMMIPTLLAAAPE